MTQPICPRFEQGGWEANVALRATLIAPLYLCMIAGVGGAYSSENLPLFAQAHQSQIVEVRGGHVRRNCSLDFPAQLVGIREMFGLTMTQLARMFGVTRQSAYAWLNGAEPKHEIRSQIQRANRYVEDLRQAGIWTVARFARESPNLGQDLIAKLISGDDLAETIASVKNAFARSAQRSSSRREFGPAERVRRVRVDEVSIPIIQEFPEQA